MRIALVNTSYPPYTVGGAERSVSELAHALAHEGHTVMVAALGPEDGTASRELDDDVTVVRIASRAFRPFASGGKNESRLGKLFWHAGELARVAEYRSLRRVLGDFAPDVVHTNNLAGFGWLGWRAARNWPIVHTMRDYYLSCMASNHWRNGRPCPPTALACRVSKAPLRHATVRPDLFVGVSDDIVERHREYGTIRPSERAETIHNQPVLSEPNVARVASGEKFVFGILGRIGSDKGTWLAIEAFLLLAQRSQRPVELRLAGSGTPSDVRWIVDLASRRDDIVYVGPADPSEFYATVDCALVPTQWPEPFGRTAAEALAVGTPLIASRTGGLPEVTERYGGSFQLVGEFHSAEAWADAMASAVSPLPEREAAGFVDVPRAHLVPDEPIHRRYLASYRSAMVRAGHARSERRS
ncbi:glycosyltransferase [Leifsonia poae]|uniref:glycosyltransferase n=1 Tax=Leifsonia poae TaxID=110933 RepID=UPI003D69D7E6